MNMNSHLASNLAEQLYALQQKYSIVWRDRQAWQARAEDLEQQLANVRQNVGAAVRRAQDWRECAEYWRLQYEKAVNGGSVPQGETRSATPQLKPGA